MPITPTNTLRYETEGRKAIITLTRPEAMNALNREILHAIGEAIGWELHGQRALVRWPWKLLWVPVEEEETRWELFDLESDPFERNDLSAQQPELTGELIDAWYRYAEDVGVATGE